MCVCEPKIIMRPSSGTDKYNFMIILGPVNISWSNKYSFML